MGKPPMRRFLARGPGTSPQSDFFFSLDTWAIVRIVGVLAVGFIAGQLTPSIASEARVQAAVGLPTPVVLTTPQQGHDVLTSFEASKSTTIPPYTLDGMLYPPILEGRFLNRDLRALRRNCVMSFASGYSAEQIHPFLKSLRDSGYSDDIVLGIWDDAPRAVHDLASKFDVTLYELPSAARDYQSKHHAEKRHNLLAIHRFAFYREWSYPYRGEDRYVLHADVRDTVFQSNPFDNLDALFPPGVNLHIIEEGRKETIGGVKEAWNRDKILQTYGDFVLEWIKDKPIVCAGVTVGRGNAFYRYVTMIAYEGVVNDFSKDDQGYHNFLYYSGRLDSLGVRAFRLGEGLVATMTYIDQVVRDDEGYILIGDRLANRLPIDASDKKVLRGMYRAPIVHQYDRFPELQQFMHKTYGM